MKKNDILELEIIDNGATFEGIAKVDGQIVFVPGTIAGEKVLAKIIKINKAYLVAKVEDFIVKSKYREDPFCEVYKKCGGCSSQHINYDMQLILKSKMVKNLLTKQKVKYNKLENTIGMGMPYYYRNKVQYPVRNDLDGKMSIGFYSSRTHNIVPNKCCYIQNRGIDILAREILDELIEKGFTGYNDDTCKGDIRHILIRRGYHTKEIMVVIIVNKESLLNDNRVKKIADKLMNSNSNIKSVFLNINDRNTNEILGKKMIKISGEDYITDYIGDFKYYISPKSFFQVNTLQTEVLYNTLKNKLNLTGNETVFDLYSGVGSIGIFLSKEARMVYGIEIEEDAVEMAKLNIKENNVINAEYIAGSVEDKIVEFKNRNISPDVIVVDPPRKGLDERSIEYILNFESKKIGYISCNPATLSRDLKLLEHKYDIISITPVDMFPYTHHVETVVLMSRIQK